MDCTPWPGHLMGGTSLRRGEAVLIILQKIPCASGMLSAGRMATSIAVSLGTCLAWPGPLTGNTSHRLHRIIQCQCGKRDNEGAALLFSHDFLMLSVNRLDKHRWGWFCACHELPASLHTCLLIKRTTVSHLLTGAKHPATILLQRIRSWMSTRERRTGMPIDLCFDLRLASWSI